MYLRLILLSAVCLALPIARASADGDPAKGKSRFGQCEACHSVAPGKNGIGPSLHQVVGRKAGTIAKFNYSSGFKKAAAKGLVWTEQNLVDYLANPKKFLTDYLGASASTKMTNKVKRLAHRKDIVSYLKTLK